MVTRQDGITFLVGNTSAMNALITTIGVTKMVMKYILLGSVYGQVMGKVNQVLRHSWLTSSFHTGYNAQNKNVENGVS